MRVSRHRRSILLGALASAGAGLLAACGVKGPLYLPEEKEEDEKKDEEKTSRGAPAPRPARLG